MAGFRVCILGDFEIERDGELLTPVRGRQKTLLCLLLMAGGECVSQDDLIQRMWDSERHPTRARATLQVHVMRLRQSLGRPAAVAYRDSGYAVDAGDFDVDLWRFSALLDEARRARAAADPHRERTVLDAASALWRGQPLAGTRSAFLDREVLPRLLDDHAVAVARRAELDGPAVGAGAAGPCRPVTPAQLPPDTPDFVGREGEVEEMTERLTTAFARGAAPQFVVSGPPGVGKSTLAVRVAHLCRDSFPDGQLYVNLRGYSEDSPLPPEVVLPRFARALGAGPADVGDLTLDEQVGLYRSLMAGRRILVVLDDAATADQVWPLLPATPGCAVVVTSRDDLRPTVLRGAMPLRLGVLDAFESWAVLERVLGNARVSAELRAVDDVVSACGGLPLALRMVTTELLANRQARIAQYAEQMRTRSRLDCFRVSGGGAVTVQATFDVSYQRLPPELARLFRLLSVVPGQTFSAPEAAALTGSTTGPAAEELDALASVNLILPAANRHHRMHDLLHEFAASVVTPAEAEEAQERLRRYYVGTAAAMDAFLYPEMVRIVSLTAGGGVPQPPPAGVDAALEWLDTECFKILALARREVPGACGFASLAVEALRGYLSSRGRAVEGWSLCRAALDAAESVDDDLARASALDLAGRLHFNGSRYRAARAAHSEALEILRRTGDLRGQASTLNSLGRIAIHLSGVSESETCDREALAISRELGDPPGIAAAHVSLGTALLSRGRITEAASAYDEALDLASGTRNSSVTSRALIGKGMTLLHRGDPDGSLDLHQRARAIAHEVGNRHLEASGHVCSGEALRELGAYEEAAAEAQKAIEIGRSVGEQRHEVSGSEVLATARMAMGDTARAVGELRAATVAARNIDYTYGEISCLIALARAQRLSEDPNGALRDAREALRRAEESGTTVLVPPAMVEAGLGQIALGHLGPAASTLRSALDAASVNGQIRVAVRARESLDVVARASVGMR